MVSTVGPFLGAMGGFRLHVSVILSPGFVMQVCWSSCRGQVIQSKYKLSPRFSPSLELFRFFGGTGQRRHTDDDDRFSGRFSPQLSSLSFDLIQLSQSTVTKPKNGWMYALSIYVDFLLSNPICMAF